MKNILKKLLSTLFFLSLCGTAIASPWGGSLLISASSSTIMPVAVMADDNPSTVSGYTADGGVTWSSPSIHSDRWGDVAWNGTIFCAVARTTNDTATSSDGQTWTFHSGAMSSASGALGIVYGGGTFVAFENSINKSDTSTDCISWTQHSMPSGVSASGPNQSYNGSVFLAIAISSSNAATSPDGITWTARTMPSTSNWQDVAWNGTVFCAVIQNSSTTATSSNGASWSSHVSALPFSGAGAIISDGTQFVATNFSTGTGAATSPDCITWTLRTLPVSIGPNAKSLVWTGANFIAIARGSGANSPDGITWSSIAAPSNIFNGASAKNLTFGSY